jgi:hypothetical protein
VLSRAKVALFVVLMCLAGTVRAQEPSDVKVVLQTTDDFVPNTITFEVIITRVSDHWDLWANTTLRLEHPDLVATGGFDSLTYSVDYQNGSSDLPLQTYDPTAMSKYAITPRITNGRISITVFGPDSSDWAFRLPDSKRSFLLGRFVLTAPASVVLRDTLMFTTPINYYQAMAFKMDHDSVTGTPPNQNVWYHKHDNVEMREEPSSFAGPPRQCDSNIIDNFTAVYVGDLVVELAFTTNCELGIEGFIIERSLVNPGDLTNLNFVERLNYTTNSILVACPVCETGKTYSGLFDGVEYRREVYAYRLIAVMQRSKERRVIDTAFVRIPNAIVSGAYLLENPFQDIATVIFNIDDRVMLSASVYDLTGKKMADLVDEQGNPIINKEYTKGAKFRARFLAASDAANGLYNIILVANPVDDKSIEQQSRVVLKAQLVR